jgi:hypothetical protein
VNFFHKPLLFVWVRVNSASGSEPASLVVNNKQRLRSPLVYAVAADVGAAWYGSRRVEHNQNGASKYAGLKGVLL